MNLDMLDASHSRLNLSKQHKNNKSRGHSLKSGRIHSERGQKTWVGNHQRDEGSLNTQTVLCGVVAPCYQHHQSC